MTDETGAVAALRQSLHEAILVAVRAAIRAEREGRHSALLTEVCADTALAWVDARLADPATVEAVAVAVHLSTHMEPDECECRPDPEDEAAAEAALAVVRGLLGGTGGEG